jgi:tetratricopeptide (TPR) repeat protein
MIRTLLLLSSVAPLVWGAAAPPEPPLLKGFDHFYNLEYDDAIAEFTRMIAASPTDPKPLNHLAQSILYREMFRAGALESELVSGNNHFLQGANVRPSAEIEKQFDDSINRAMSLSQTALSTNANDTQALYAQGVAYGLRANYNFLVKKAWRDSLKDATAARKLHNRISELDPTFYDARMVQGVHDYVVGSLPLTYKMLGFLVGFRGDREAGIRAVELVSTKGSLNRIDAKVLLAVVYRRERQAGKALPLLEDLVRSFPRNYLFRFEMVQMYGDLGRKDDALQTLATLEELKKANTAGFKSLPLEKIYYSRGNLLFWYRDLDQALDNLNRVTGNAKELDHNTGMNAWLRTGQIYDMKNERKKAVAAYQQAINGAPDSDAAKEARRYLSSPYRRA